MSASSDSLRIGFVGAGGIVRTRHLPNLKLIPGLDFVAVCNQRRETAETIGRDFGIHEVMTDWKKLIARDDIDIIWIGTPPYMHAELTTAALKAGKHVFCQARMAMNLAQGREMLAAAKAHPKQVTMLCPPPHGMRGDPVVRRLLKDQVFGRLLHFRLQAFTDAWANPATPAHWRQKVELSGQNILSVGIYAEVVGNWLGHPEQLHATHHVFHPDRQGYKVRIPDWVSVTGRWPNGLYGSLEWSGVAQAAYHEKLTVFGEAGTMVYDFTEDRLYVAINGQKSLHERPIRAEEQGNWTVEADFIKAVREGGHPEPSFETGVKYMEFLDAIYRSEKL